MKTKNYYPPEWAFEFHGHRCPFMPIGYRMGKLALEFLEIEREKDHYLFVFPEAGIGHPQICFIDGIQAATGATYGKSLVEKTSYGKLAAVFYHIQYLEKGAVRYALKSEFIDSMGKFEFFNYRRRGIEPSQIPHDVADQVINWVYNQKNEEMFNVKQIYDYKFSPPQGSFNKAKCSVCGEYVFERYLRNINGKLVCIPCSGYGK